MEQQPIDINLESKEILINEVYGAGDRIEKAIAGGEKIFLKREEGAEEGDLLWLRALVEKTGIDLGKIEGVANLAEQAGQLVAAIGAERLLRMMPELMVEIIRNPAGEVFKGEEEKPEDADKEIRDFVVSFLNKQINRDKFIFDPTFYKKDWQNNIVCRLEAVMSVMNKLLWIMQSNNVDEDFRRQNTDGILKHLRERVMRGEKRAEEKDGEVVDPKNEVIRFLPPKSVGVILEHLTRL